MHIWMYENNKKREGELMIITKDVLKNLKLKKGEISEKRCQEINAKEKHLNLEYKGQLYKWKHWNE